MKDPKKCSQQECEDGANSCFETMLWLREDGWKQQLVWLSGHKLSLVLFPSSLITVLSSSEPHSQWEWATEAVWGCGPGTPANIDKINIRIRGQFLAPASQHLSVALLSFTSLVNPFLLSFSSLSSCLSCSLSPFLPVLLSLPHSFPSVLPDGPEIMGQ